MDRIIIDNINRLVEPEDELYILGYFSMHGSYTKNMRYREQINCNHVYLIIGNHDNKLLDHGKKSPFECEKDYCEIRYNNILFCLSHYPFMSWREENRGSIMCHGHIHSPNYVNEIQYFMKNKKRFDVGVDANAYKPVSIDSIINFFNSRKGWYSCEN
jgi:calcineurin-like phosphoesterase family protein